MARRHHNQQSESGWDFEVGLSNISDLQAKKAYQTQLVSTVSGITNTSDGGIRVNTPNLTGLPRWNIFEDSAEITLSQFTIQFEMQRGTVNGLSNFVPIINKATSNANMRTIYMFASVGGNSANSSFMVVGNNESTSGSGNFASPFDLNIWNTYKIIFDNSNLALYKNGILVKSFTHNQPTSMPVCEIGLNALNRYRTSDGNVTYYPIRNLKFKASID